MLDKWIEELKKGNCISEPDLKKLCIQVNLVSPFNMQEAYFLCITEIELMLSLSFMIR